MELELASKQVRLGSDGASVLTGEFNGLIAQLRQRHAPFVVPQHDAGHKTNLASAVLDDHALFVKLRSIVSGASTFFSCRWGMHACMLYVVWMVLLVEHAVCCVDGLAGAGCMRASRMLCGGSCC